MRQECPLSLLLFNLVLADLEEIMEKVRWGGIKLRKGRIYTLEFGDDVVMLAKTEREMNSMIERLEKYLDEKRLKLNRSKTKILRFRKGGGKIRRKVGGDEKERR